MTDADLPATGGRTHAERVETFLGFACWDHHVHGKGDHRMYDRAAQRLLAQHPEIARDSIYTAIVCGEIQEVERTLGERPEAACEPGGSRGWTPLLYLCYTRFSHQPTIENAVAVGRALLDRGANPNDFYMAGDARYTALVGVAGEGEQDSPRQPRSQELFQLLLEGGAEPFDVQVLYNTHFSGDVLWWLELIYAHTARTSRKAPWEDPSWSMLDMGGYGPGVHFLLALAVKKNDLQLAEWLLAHGASPNVNSSPHPRFKPTTTHYQEAVRNGVTAMTDLLVRHGATPSEPVLDDYERFAAACFRLDRLEAQALLERHPEYLRDHRAMFAAARRDRADAVAFLLDLGVSIEIEDRHKQRPLHEAAGHGALGVARLLIQHGAEIDPRDAVWNATPIGFAAHSDRLEMIELLSQFSRNVWTLAFRGYAERLGEVLRAEPELARAATSEGITPLWWLPDDQTKALEIVELFLIHGADPSSRNEEGRTAADWALKRGMSDVAARLVAAAAERPSREAAVPIERPGPGLEPFESLAKDVVVAYEGYPPAMQRLCEHYRRALAWNELRAAVQERLRAVLGPERPADGMYEGYFALPHARLLIAREAGFENWAELAKSLEAGNPPSGPTKTPP